MSFNIYWFSRISKNPKVLFKGNDWKTELEVGVHWLKKLYTSKEINVTFKPGGSTVASSLAIPPPDSAPKFPFWWCRDFPGGLGFPTFFWACYTPWRLRYCQRLHLIKGEGQRRIGSQSFFSETSGKKGKRRNKPKKPLLYFSVLGKQHVACFISEEWKISFFPPKGFETKFLGLCLDPPQ